MTTGRKRRVLVIESQESVRADIVHSIGDLYQVVPVPDWDSAAEYLKKFPVAAVLLDSILQDLDGLQLIPHIRILTAAPIVVMTEVPTPAALEMVVKHRVEGHLTKPIDTEKSRHTMMDVVPLGVVAYTAGMLRRHYDRDLNAQEIADHVGVSVGYLRSEFAKKYGKSPVEFLTEIRMRRALELLRRQQWQIQDVAKLIGISSSDRFRRTFIRYFGFPPSQIKPERGHTQGLPPNEGLACAAFSPPIPLAASVDEQFELAKQGRYIHCNNTYARMYGFQDRVEVIGKTLVEVIKLQNQNHVDRFKDLIRSGYHLEAVVAEPNVGVPIVPTLVKASGVVRDGCLIELWAALHQLPGTVENSG